MKSIEVSGKTIDEAIFNGIDQMGLSIDEVDIEIVEEGGKRLFGIGSKLATVRLTEREPEVVEQLREEEKKAFEQQKAATTREDRPRSQNRSGGHGGADRDRNRSRNAGGNRGRGGNNNRSRSREREESIPPRVLGEPVALGVEGEFLDGTLKRMGLTDAKVEAYHDGEITLLNISGPSMGILIGRRGDTLNALQYLCSLVGNKNDDEYRRVVVDTENYRHKRDNVLKKLARRKAEDVVRTGRPVSMEPMNPYERRVLHATLQQIDGVTTQSRGEEPNRYVVILPDTAEK
ncbi:Jag N-terminal domain-containing protein [Eubacteriales bacterium OttesenSCG-928-N14]|nr:Jag N-terminal domain-containing protein [Eubacteriales bacterium OttesenSCG-928-N14]